MCTEDSWTLMLGKALAYLTVLLFSFIGNGMVLHVFYKNRNIRTTTNSLIVNMAASDIMIPIFVIPRHIVASFEKGLYKLQVWHVDGLVGEMLCKLVPFIGDVSHCVSILTLVLISVDRYIAICWPLSTKYKITPSRCNFLIATTWVVALLINVRYLYTFKLTPDSRHFCVSFWGSLPVKSSSEQEFHDQAKKSFTLGLMILIYLVPLATITILYSSIIQELRSKQRMQSIHQPTHCRRQRRREDNRVIAMLVVIVSIFAVFFAPYHITVFIQFFVFDLATHLGCSSMSLHFANIFLTLTICAINPYIYFIFIRRYRQCAKAFLKCLCGARIFAIFSKISSWKCWLQSGDNDDEMNRRTIRANSSCRARQTELILLALDQEPTLQFETGL